MMDRPHVVYVLNVLIGNAKIPIACYASRAGAVYAVETQLEEILHKFLKASFQTVDCVLLEQWLVNGFLDSSHAQSLASYDRFGNLIKILIPEGQEPHLSKPSSNFEQLAKRLQHGRRY